MTTRPPLPVEVKVSRRAELVASFATELAAELSKSPSGPLHDVIVAQQREGGWRRATTPLEAGCAVTWITMAELAAGPHLTSDPAERARGQGRLLCAEAAFDPIPFDAAAARAYGRIYAAVVARGRKARGSRAIDLMIAAVAAGVLAWSPDFDSRPCHARTADRVLGL